MTADESVEAVSTCSAADPEMMIPNPDPGDGVRLAVIDVIDHLLPGRTS
ncbi:hypothetical protein [Streptosporangium sp. H16]